MTLPSLLPSCSKTMSGYSGNCDNCGKPNIAMAIEVVKSEGGGFTSEFWCIDCLRRELLKSG